MRAGFRRGLALATAGWLLLAPTGALAGSWAAAEARALPDEAFAVVRVRPDGTRVRRLPHHDAHGRLDPPHLRSALARLGQVAGLDSAEVAGARQHLRDHARELGWRTPP